MEETYHSDSGRRLFTNCLLSGWITFIVILAVLFYFGIIPFGSKSLVYGDINVSQLDIYGYLKDCLEGKNTLGYTFSMGLGGDTLNVFGYSMSSPLNFLIVFFKKSQFHLFFSTITIIKLTCISMSMSFYLTKRFNKLQTVFVLLLSLSYALCQYCIAQICNIFWLDGVFMLPFILYGLYRIIQGGKPYFFAVSVYISVLFNWYSGAINCLFAIFWYLFESALYKVETDEFDFQCFASNTLRCIIGGISGVLMSGILLFPVIKAVQMGNRGSFNWNMLTNTFNGNIFTAISNNTINSISTSSQVSLFCGSFVLIGYLSYFLSKHFNWKKKIISGFFFLFILLSFYWQPLFLLFSLLKFASSFWFRFGYIVFFLMVYLAACFYSELKVLNRKQILVFVGSAITFTSLLLVTNLLLGTGDKDTILFTLVGTIVICFVLMLFTYKNTFTIKLLLVFVCVGELSFNTKLLLDTYHTDDSEQYVKYVLNEETIINNLKNKDQNNYRINKTYNRARDNIGLTANYNESFMYNYWGIASYTNSPDDIQRNFLERIGYRKNGENFYIVNDSILAADTLLGVKYLLSKTDYEGYTEISRNGDKKILKNNSHLPMSFIYNKNTLNTKYNGNTFEYLNQLYSRLYGRKVNIFIPVKYTKAEISNGTNYDLKLLSGHYAYYGNFKWNYPEQSNILLNDKELTPYSQWKSPSVFYLPVDNEHNSLKVTLQTNDISNYKEEFYALDLSLLNKVAKKIRSNGVEKEKISNGDIEIKLKAKDNQILYTSIPYSENWVIIDNGKQVKPQLFGDCLMNIPLTEGEHTIKINYELPGIKSGVFSTIFGVLILIGYYLFSKRNLQEREGFDEK